MSDAGRALMMRLVDLAVVGGGVVTYALLGPRAGAGYLAGAVVGGIGMAVSLRPKEQR